MRHLPAFYGVSLFSRLAPASATMSTNKSASVETTEWDDILTKFGIKNSAKETEAEAEAEVQQSLEEDAGDEDDEEVFRRYREMRLSELKAAASKPLFAEVEEITGQDFVQKVTKAGPGVWVVIHLYKAGVVACSLINQLLPQLAARFPQTKFLKSISSLCIANFPDENLPGLLIYCDGKCMRQIFGAHHFPANLKMEDLEWLLHKAKAVTSDMDEDPRKKQEKGGKFFESVDSDSDQSSAADDQ